MDSAKELIQEAVLAKSGSGPPPISRGDSTSSNGSLNDSQEEPTFQAAMKAIIARKKKPSKTQNSSSCQAEKVAKMIDDYLEKPLMSQSDNPLDFWREFSNGDRFQKALSHVAKHYLTTPCSTVP